MICAEPIVSQISNYTKPSPNGRRPRQGNLLEHARQLHAWGINVIPLDGQKKPIIKWKSKPDWTTNRQTITDVNRFNWRNAKRIAAVCGAVSGDLRCVDFDKQPDRAAVDRFLIELGLPVDYPWCEHTPGGGWHVWLICPDLIPPDDHRGGKVDREGITAGHIELRFEGVLTTFYFETMPNTPPATASGAQVMSLYSAVTAAPKPEPEPARQSYTAPDLPSDASELEEIERRARALIVNTLVKRGGKAGYYNCPLEHGHDGKDFLFSPEPGQPIGGCQGKHAGQLTRWRDLAEFCGHDVSQIARDVAAEHAPISSHNRHEKTSADSIHYPGGFPWTLTRFLLTVKDKTVDRLDLADLATVELLHTVCAMPATVTVIEFVRLAADRGWSIDRRKVAAVLRWGANEPGMYKNEPNDSSRSRAFGSNLITAVYRFKPVDQRLRLLGEYLAPRMAAPRRAPATAGEIAAILGESGAGLEGLDAPRAEAMAASAADRAEHQRRAARWLAVWKGSMAHILDGTYQPLTLEPQALSAPKLRTAIARQLLGEGVEVRRLVDVTGLSKNTVLKLAREADLESVPQTATIPADRVTTTMRERSIVIAESGGMATIHTPNVFKRRDTLTADEQRAVRAQQAQQRGRARGRLGCPQTPLEAAHRRADIRHQEADKTAARRLIEMIDRAAPRPKIRRDPLDRWLDYQWNLAPPLSPPPIDPDTGEVLTGRARWRAAVEIARGNTMFTFAAQTAHKDENESEDRPTYEPSEPPAPIVEATAPRRRKPAPEDRYIAPRPDPYWDSLYRVMALFDQEAAR